MRWKVSIPRKDGVSPDLTRIPRLMSSDPARFACL